MIHQFHVSQHVQSGYVMQGIASGGRDMSSSRLRFVLASLMEEYALFSELDVYRFVEEET
jgi:hypothetical protein